MRYWTMTALLIFAAAAVGCGDASDTADLPRRSADDYGAFEIQAFETLEDGSIEATWPGQCYQSVDLEVESKDGVYDELVDNPARHHEVARFEITGESMDACSVGVPGCESCDDEELGPCLDAIRAPDTVFWRGPGHIEVEAGWPEEWGYRPGGSVRAAKLDNRSYLYGIEDIEGEDGAHPEMPVTMTFDGQPGPGGEWSPTWGVWDQRAEVIVEIYLRVDTDTGYDDDGPRDLETTVSSTLYFTEHYIDPECVDHYAETGEMPD